MKFSKEFKQAISHLPYKEKDKLLFRLLKKDSILIKRLEYELIDERTLEDRRDQMEEFVIEQVDVMTNNFHSPGYLNMDIRFLSGYITEHVKVTKDKFGEVSLNLLMLNRVLEKNNDNLMKKTPEKNKKLGIAILTRAFKIMILINKLHEDLFIELEDDLKRLGQLILQNDHLMKLAIHHGFDVKWLIQANIPEDIAAIQKDLKDRGYLTTKVRRMF
jgi:hypothetical protein